LDEVVIVAARRTPVGSFGGALSSLPASELGAAVIKALLSETDIAPESVDDVILGHVLTAAAGQNTARQAALAGGLPDTVPALTINRVCGSGLDAVALARQAILAGNATTIIAGGQENMSAAVHALPSSRSGQRMGNWEMVDTMITDGLWCAMNNYHMGQTADGDPTRVDKDEYPKPDSSMEKIATLRAAFQREGTVTAANASGINDGAAAVIVMSAEQAKSSGLRPLATIKASATAGVDPAIMGYGPVPAVTTCLERAGWTLDQLDLIESNEAFAAQSLTVMRKLGLDPNKVNVNGGAIALGHPIGASGARILVTLLHEMKRRKTQRGLATLCIGGGQGVALALENVSAQ